MCACMSRFPRVRETKARDVTWFAKCPLASLNGDQIDCINGMLASIWPNS